MNRRQRLRRARLRLLCWFGPPGLAAGMWLVGLVLPARHVVEERTHFNVSAETVWAVLTDLDGMPTWRRGLQALERLPDVEGQVRWIEVRSAGRSTTFQRVESVSPRRLVVQSSEPSGRWVYDIRALDRGSELTIREERDLNPIMRTVVGIFGDRARLAALTADLARRLTGRREQLAARAAD